MQDGYKNLITYKLARVAFDLVWDFVPRYYWRFEDSRQRDQMKQAIRSHKQGIVEGSSSRSLSSKLTLYGVAQSSGKEIKEDNEDILRLEGLPLWQKDDPRLRKLRQVFEDDFNPPYPSAGALLAVLGKKLEGNRRMKKEEVEIVANYLVDLLARNGYLLDKQIRAVEEKHRTEGGYHERLLKRRLSFRRRLSVFFYFLLLPSLFLLFLPRPVHAAQLSNQFTVGLWVNPSGAVASKALLVKNNELRLVTDGAGKPLCQIYSGGAWQTAAVSTAALSLNSWSHVACSYDKSTLKVFLNGVQTGSASLAVALDDSAANFRAGADEGGVYSDLNGSIDEVRIYNYARTQKQILEDKEGGAPGTARLPQPIAHWKFDEGYGTTAHDAVGANHGTLGVGSSAPAWTNEGEVGKALRFDGNDDYLSRISTDSLQISTDISIGAWVYLNNTGVEQTILGKWDETTGTDDRSYRLWVSSSNKLSFSLSSDGTSGNTYTVTGGTTLLANRWYYLSASADVGTNMKVYVDAKLDGTDISGNPSAISANPSILYIGGKENAGGGVDTLLNGRVDEVKIYNYALSEEEVKQDYNQGMAAVMGQSAGNTGSTAPAGSAAQEYCVPGSTDYCAPPVAEWNFEEGAGTSAYDISGNENTGYIEGTGNNYYVKGKNGKAIRCANPGKYIRIPDSLSQSFTNALTIELFFNQFDSSGGQNLFAKQSGWDYLMEIWNGGGIDFYLNGAYKGSSSNFARNVWHHIGLVFQRPEIKLYLDGKLDKTNTNDSDLYDSTGDLFIGAYTQYGRFFNGLIDDFRIYNYARTPAQIAWDYNRGAPVGWWRFDECQGTVAHDVSGGNLNGAINIGATAPQTAAGTCASVDVSYAWYNGREGKLNSAMSFDGADDYAAIGSTGRTDIATLSFWAKPASTTQKIIELSASDSVEISSGAVAVTGFGTEKVYVDGVETSSFADTNWHHITVVGSAGLTANAMNIGKVGTNYYSGLIDDVRIYNYALTATQIRTLYNNGAVKF